MILFLFTWKVERDTMTSFKKEISHAIQLAIRARVVFEEGQMQLFVDGAQPLVQSDLTYVICSQLCFS